MARFDEQMAATSNATLRNSAVEMKGVGAARERTATEQANQLEQMAESALNKVDELCGRMGRPGARPPMLTGDKPTSLIVGAMDMTEQHLQQIHDALDFLRSRL